MFNKKINTVKRSAHGFTIVELIIVIVVIGILAAVSIVAYQGFSDRAKRAQAQSHLSQLKKSIMMAQFKTRKSIREIAATDPPVWQGLTHYDGSPSYGVDYPCPPDMSGVYMTNTTHHCVISYSRFIDRLIAIVGPEMESLRTGDPWGRPYVIDDEEDGSIEENCNSVDRISSAGPSGWRADWNRSTNSWWKVTVYPESYDGIIMTIPRVKERPGSC